MISFKKLSIKTQLLLVGVILISVIPIIIIQLYQQSSEIIIKQNTQYNIELVSNLQQTISTNYAQISNIMMNLGYNATVQEFLIEKDKQAVYEMSKEVLGLMNIVKSSNPDIQDIIIINDTHKSLSLMGNVDYAQNLQFKLEKKRGIVHYGGFAENNILQPFDSFLFGLNLFASQDMTRYGEKIGFITVVLDTKSINKSIELDPNILETSLYLWTNNELVYSNKQNAGSEVNWVDLEKYKYNDPTPIYEQFDGKNYAIQSFQIPEIEGGIISVTATSQIIKDLDKLEQVSYLIFFITVTVVAIIYSVLLMNILKPHRQLIEFMNTSKRKNLDVLHSKVDLVGYAEIEVISSQFNTMLIRINELTHQLLEANAQLYLSDIERQKAEMLFLQSQIKPHFLSNTLDTIKGMALVTNNREIFNMASALSRMLRYSIKGNDEVTLDEELIIVQSYITIHQGRFPNRITYTCHCPEELRAIVVPKMILQPLVENALTHGIEPHPEGGNVIITVDYINDDHIEIKVADNGVGIDQEKLAYLQQFLEHDHYNTSKHIGIKNVHTRLQLKYGNKSGIQLSSSVQKGTTIKMIIPLPSAIHK